VASQAFRDHLLVLLQDAEHLDEASRQLPTGVPGRPHRVAALNRALVVMCVSAWEAYVEALVAECLVALRPSGPSLGPWPVHNASVRSQLGRFNNPNSENVRMFLSDALGMPNVHAAWAWRSCSPAQAVHRLSDAMRYRHEIAHGVNPRPVVASLYSSGLPDFFRRLGRCTDRAVRDHLVNTLGITNPWPP
jgi:hypothetical protein